MTEKRFFKKEYSYDWWFIFDKKQEYCEDMKIPFTDVGNLIAMSEEQVVDLLNELNDENEHLKKDLKRCKDWINSDKNDYQLTLAFIKNKGYSLKDVLEYEKELEK